MATVNYNEVIESRFAEDLEAVAKPAISASELSQAYKHFGVKPKVQGKTDQQLFKRATLDVLQWWKSKGKKQGFYQTTTAGKPMGQSGNRPPTAEVPVFGRGYMDSMRKQYGLMGTNVPEWATKSETRFQQWLEIQLRRRGMTLNG